jgi:hypothetical protein
MPFSQNLRRLRLARFSHRPSWPASPGCMRSPFHASKPHERGPSRTVRALATSLAITPGELALPSEVAEAD